VGEQELVLLRWVAERGPVSVGEAAETFGAPRGLARSTVLTMMERLRAKKRLTRRRAGGVFLYRSPDAPEQVLRAAVSRFVEGTLGGSLSPFVRYLAEAEDLPEDEVAELQAIVARLRARRGGV
jgi:predicted transcriptional regulator